MRHVDHSGLLLRFVSPFGELRRRLRAEALRRELFIYRAQNRRQNAHIHDRITFPKSFSEEQQEECGGLTDGSQAISPGISLRYSITRNCMLDAVFPER
jgi:hypothetical protein